MNQSIVLLLASGVCLVVAFIFFVLLDPFFRGEQKKKRWLRKKERLDRKNYIERQLKRLMPALLSYAKSLGISFGVNPESFKLRNGRGWIWTSVSHRKDVLISINPKTLEITPRDPLERKRAMAHEIGHIKAKGKDSGPPCLVGLLQCLHLEDLHLEGIHYTCFLRELWAEAEGRKVLNAIYSGGEYSACLKDYNQWADIIQRHCSLCLTEIKEGRCAKTEEVSSLCETLGIELEAQEER